jgi:hypothetical protein
MQVEAGALVRQTAERFGDRTALTAQARSLSFTDLNAAANRVGSALLELGARRGDRVGVLAYNTPGVVEAWFGFEKHSRQTLTEPPERATLTGPGRPPDRLTAGMPCTDLRPQRRCRARCFSRSSVPQEPAGTTGPTWRAGHFNP